MHDHEKHFVMGGFSELHAFGVLQINDLINSQIFGVIDLGIRFFHDSPLDKSVLSFAAKRSISSWVVQNDVMRRHSKVSSSQT